MLSKELLESKNFSGMKFIREDFSGLKLPKANFNMASCIECNFTNTDLKFSSFVGANCFGSNFTQTNLNRVNMTDCILENTIFDPRDAFGLTLTLRCETFTGTKIGKTWLHVWGFIPSLMDLPEVEEKKIITLLGTELWTKYKAIFSRRVF